MSLNLKSSGGGSVTVDVPSTASDYTATLPAANITVVGTDTTQTLTNKTLSGAVMSNMASSVITSGTSVSASGTSVNFTGIPSWVKRITVMFNGVSTSGTSIPLVQLGTSSGIVATGYLGTAEGAAGNVGGATLSTGFQSSNVQAATYLMNGLVTICLIGSNTWAANGIFGNSEAARVGIMGGSVPLGAVLTTVRITTVNGTDTFDAGSINILYE